jgi:integrase/recombinase XerD
VGSARSRPRELPKVLSSEEVAALMAVPNLDAPTGLRNRCILAVMHRAGLRVSEACDLELRDVRWREEQLHLRAEATKTKTEAYQTLNSETLALLERWKVVRRQYAARATPRSPYLFTTLQGGRVGRQYVWSMLQRYARRAGIEHAHPHMLRHTLATELLREGYDLREVQKVMRHADIRTTVVYTHISDVQLHARLRER